jgi:hypothetical protein
MIGNVRGISGNVYAGKRKATYGSVPTKDHIRVTNITDKELFPVIVIRFSWKYNIKKQKLDI